MSKSDNVNSEIQVDYNKLEYIKFRYSCQVDESKTCANSNLIILSLCFKKNDLYSSLIYILSLYF